MVAVSAESSSLWAKIIFLLLSIVCYKVAEGSADAARSFRFPDDGGRGGGVGSGQVLRLRGGRAVNVGYLEIYSGRRWNLLCSSDFGLQEATVACRQLGYRSAVHHTAGNSTIGDLDFVLHDEDGIRGLKLDLGCRGEERDLAGCGGWNLPTRGRCNVARDVVGLACGRPSFALCPRSTEPFGDSCYEVVSEAGNKKDFIGALAACNQKVLHRENVN